ncbi:hypothetical protein Tco_0117758 [Tanacetum coccineum]
MIGSNCLIKIILGAMGCIGMNAPVERFGTMLIKVMSTQEHLVDTNTKSRPVEDLRETEVPQPLLVEPSPIPSSDDLAPDNTITIIIFDPSHTEEVRGTSELVEDTEDNSSDSGTEREGSEEEGPDSEDEGHGSEDEGPGLGYGALRHRELVVGEDEMPSTFEVGCSSRSVPELEGAERIYSFRQPTIVTWVDPEDGRVRAISNEISLSVISFRSLKASGMIGASSDISAIIAPVIALKDGQDIADDRHERLELIDRVAKRGRRQESRGEY